MLENQESISLTPALLHITLNDDAEEARYTFGEMWFQKEKLEEVRDLAALKEPVASVKVFVHRRVYHFQNVNFDFRIHQEGKDYVKINYSADDLISINEWAIPAQSTKR